MPLSRYFGSIAPEADCVEQSITLGEDRVRLDLNILAPTTLAQSEIDRVDATLDELASVDALARDAIASAMSDDAQQPAQFWQFHHDEVPGYESLARDEMHAALALKRVGFYPDGAHGARSFVLLDDAARTGDRSAPGREARPRSRCRRHRVGELSASHRPLR